MSILEPKEHTNLFTEEGGALMKKLLHEMEGFKRAASTQYSFFLLLEHAGYTDREIVLVNMIESAFSVGAQSMMDNLKSLAIKIFKQKGMSEEMITKFFIQLEKIKEEN